MEYPSLTELLDLSEKEISRMDEETFKRVLRQRITYYHSRALYLQHLLEDNQRREIWKQS